MSLLSFIRQIEIAKLQSSLNGEVRVVENYGKRTLLVNNAEQSGGTITEMWDKSISKIKNKISKIKTCLVLGLGGGTLIRLLNKYYPDTNITAIEFDPVIIDVARKYFGIEQSNKLKIINGDAFDWIKDADGKYDLIFFDLYLGKFNPKKSREAAFLRNLKHILSPSGLLVFNAHYQNNEAEYEDLLKSGKKVFEKVELILSYRYSRILLLG